jgi:Ca-activated chloride channel family protein
LARPQTLFSEDKIKTEGIDIVLAMDISGSMLAMDFEPNRLEAAKNTAMQFVNERTNDRIGVVLFAGESFTQMPLTADKTQLTKAISQITNTGVLEQGTAIGMGLANSVARLEESKAKSKVVILLTDGVNNAGSIDPITATQTAKEFNVKVYTIGVGTYGEARMPINTMFGVQYAMQKVEIDEELMKQIANETGGQYFRATDDKKLQDIYKEINKLEKTSLEINSNKQYKEQFYPLVLLALLLLTLEIVLRKTWFHTINE